MAEEVKYPSYRWVVLLVAWATFVMLTYNWNFTATRLDMVGDLGITLTQFHMVFTGPTLAAIFLCVPGGLLGDRFGIRMVVGIGALIAVVGCLLRLTATGFGTVFGYTILVGVGLGVMFPNLPKLVGVWFPPKQVGLATGIYMTGMGLGMALGLATGTMFSSWQSAQLILGIVFAVCVVAWFVLARNKPAGITVEAHERGSVTEALSRTVRSKNMWFIIVIQILVGVIILSYIGSLPSVLPAKGMTLGSASMVSALAVFGFLVGTIFWPVISTITGIRNPIFVATMVLTGVTGLLVYFLAPGIGMWVLAFFPGFFIAPGLTFMLMAPVELPEIGPRFAATAAGALLTAFNLGAFVGLPYIFHPLLEWSSTGAFAFLLGGCVVTGLLGLGIMELGRKAQEKRAKEAAG
ncbi:MAG: MFS transporter [Chloroflexota bacterium]|nr:MFS transporter [Chloroflexota bacterium]